MAAAVQCVVSPGVGLGQRNHPFGDLAPERRHARGARLVAQKPVDPGGHEPLLPAPDCGLALAGQTHDLDRSATFTRQQHDPGTPDVLLRAVAIGHHRFKANTVGGTHIDADSFAHATDSHALTTPGILFRILPSDFVH
jgi:hypothetical protein